MKQFPSMLVIAALIFAAETKAMTVDEMQLDQQQRIAQGYASGKLSKKEVNQLIAQQKRISHKVQKFRSDGVLSLTERSILNNELAESSANIYWQKHDRQPRY